MDNTYFRQIINLLRNEAFKTIPINQAINADYKIAIMFSQFLLNDMRDGFYEALFNLTEEQAETFYNSEVFSKGMIMALLIQDLFLKLNRESLLGTINEQDERLFKILNNAIEKDDFKIIFTDLKSVPEFVKATLHFADLSAYNKVEMFKCLDFQDMQMLQAINPNFFDEYKKYAIDINQEWIMRQINKWINHSKDEYQAFKETAQFLINAFNMDIDISDVYLEMLNSGDDEPDFMNLAMLNRDVEQVSVYVSKFYYRHKGKDKKLV